MSKEISAQQIEAKRQAVRVAYAEFGFKSTEYEQASDELHENPAIHGGEG